MNIIDSHVHIGTGAKMLLEAENLIRQMDEAGIGFAVACPMDRYIAVDNAEGNNFIMNAVKSHPDRLAGMAVANPWFGEKSCDLLRKAFDEGFAGFKIHSVLQGFRLSDPIVYPLLEVAAEYGVPVYAHTGTAGLAEPFHAAELARRFPSVNFIMGHAGASDYYNDTVRALEFADNLWIETSRNGPANFAQFKNCGLSGRTIFGSNAPEYIQEAEIRSLEDVFTDEEDREKIFSLNVKEAFKGRIKG